MKSIQELSASKVPIVVLDPALGKYRDATPFARKLALANERLKGVVLPTGQPVQDSPPAR